MTGSANEYGSHKSPDIGAGIHAGHHTVSGSQLNAGPKDERSPSLDRDEGTNFQSSKNGYRNYQDFNHTSHTSKKNSRTTNKVRNQTARVSAGARRNFGGRNPYISDIFKEGELLTASNAYHRLDKSQNFNCNKAFAHTILNDLKQRQRQNEFEKRLGMLN